MVVVAANPYSGSRANRERVRDLTTALGERGYDARAVWTPEERAAVMGDAELMQRCRCIVAAGGDGTVHTLINDRPSAPLAVLPLGTENIFAREYGFTLDMELLAGRIARGETRTIDLGRVGERRFSLMLGVGIDADVAHRLARWRAQGAKLKRVSYLSYINPGLSSLWRYAYPELEIDADGERMTGAYALIFNIPRYALGLPIAPGARADDGLLDWVVFRKPGKFRLLGYIVSVLGRSHLQRSDVRHGRAKRIRITGVKDAPVQVDGDPFGTTPVEAEVVPSALTVVV